jgi:hypothetical protein
LGVSLGLDLAGVDDEALADAMAIPPSVTEAATWVPYGLTVRRGLTLAWPRGSASGLSPGLGSRGVTLVASTLLSCALVAPAAS